MNLLVIDKAGGGGPGAHAAQLRTQMAGMPPHGRYACMDGGYSKVLGIGITPELAVKHACQAMPGSTIINSINGAKVGFALPATATAIAASLE